MILVSAYENKDISTLIDEANDYYFSSFNDYVTQKVPKEVLNLVFGSADGYKSIINSCYNSEKIKYIDVENQFGEYSACTIVQ